MCIITLLNINAQSILFNSLGGTPDTSSLLELRSTEKGFLAPRMNSTQRLAISTPAQGLLVFQTNGTVGFYFYNGSGWDTLGGATTVTNISNVTNVASSGIAVIRDVKTTGTDGGTFTSGAWRTRDINNIDGDVSFVALGTNTFTLDSGTYVVTISAPAYEVDEHQIRLYNNTDAAVESTGAMAYSDKFAASTSTIITVVNVGAATETFKIEHRCTTTNSTDGFGLGAAWGQSVFTQVKIEKL